MRNIRVTRDITRIPYEQLHSRKLRNFYETAFQ